MYTFNLLHNPPVGGLLLRSEQVGLDIESHVASVSQIALIWLVDPLCDSEVRGRGRHLLIFRGVEAADASELRG